jgi:hypothetical protein
MALKVTRIEITTISLEMKRFLEWHYSAEVALRKRYARCDRKGHQGEEVEGRCGYCWRLLDRTLDVDRDMKRRAGMPLLLQPMDAPWIARRYQVEREVLEANDLLYGLQKLAEFAGRVER